MIKIKYKLFITLFVATLLLLSSICLATNTSIPVSTSIEEDVHEEVSDTRYSDLYVSNEKQYDIQNIIEGNVFASVDILNINSTNNGSITGNLYAMAQNVNIKSDVVYSESEVDEFGNSKIESLNSISTIGGSVFVCANKFVLEPGCEIDGDLYVCATEVELGQNSIIYGNVFVTTNKLVVNSQIGGDLYASAKNFDMQYYGFIYRDLHLDSENANINGYVYRNSFINSNNIVTNDKFINEKDFTVENATNVTLSGEIKGNANINSTNINFKNTVCKISGDLNYSSLKELQIEDRIVSGNINYSKYEKPSSNKLSIEFLDYIIKLLTTLVYISVIYFIIKKFMPKYSENLSKFNISNLLISLGIGLGVLIIIPIISILLFVTGIGSILGALLLLLYILLLMLAKPVFVILVSKFIKDRFSKSITNYVYIIIVTICLSLISLIPYVGFIVSTLVLLIGLGCFIKSLKKG
ncbi:MAG: hypothetical protein Q4G09_03680 [Clostridia bacterium]|nr:hypothetical protein [Clostridia bacterium]